MNTEKLKEFKEIYTEELVKAITNFPSEYAFPLSDVHIVVDRMMKAIEKGSFLNNSRAIKATCKRLEIKHTYKAIGEFLEKGN